MIDRYAVMGNPVAHSKSPFIHLEFAKQTHQHIRYTKIEVPIDKFEQHVKLFHLENGKGLNITVPFKQQAFELVTDCSDRARVAKAVNTIKFLENGQLYGDNTDGIGFIRDLSAHHHFSLQDRTILLLGAGGAVRGIIQPILQQHPKQLIIANRTLITAQELAKEFSHLADVEAISINAIKGNFDLIINGTSLSLNQGDIPFDRSILSKKTFCYDLMYGQKLTPFLKWAVSNGASRVTDGIGMLVEQAAESFFIWRGVRPETKKIIDMLKQS